MRYLCRFKPSRNYLRGFLIAAWERVPKLESSPFQKHHFIFSLACGSFFVSPAYAGKSVVRELLLIVSRDHPRVCGEKTLCSRPFTSCAGSPPRMRGKAIPPRPYPCVSRITPAYAGKRASCKIVHNKTPDHPRACGEKLIIPCASSSVQGSPPRMRGKGRKGHGSRHQTRITPAYAGKNL